MRISKRFIDSDYQPIMRSHDFRQPRLLRYTRRHFPTAKDLEVSCRSAFIKATEVVASVSLDRGILGGAPCIRGTRIPVYMVLDAVEYYGSLKGALKSYPHLTLEQVKDAVRFAKLVLEHPVDNEAASSS